MGKNNMLSKLRIYIDSLRENRAFNKKYNRVNQLIIIGNGFDLHLHDIDDSHNLTSRFVDFIDAKYSYFETYFRKIYNSNFNSNMKRNVLYIKISNLIFKDKKSISGHNAQVFNTYVDKIKKDHRLSNFNFWIIYLLFVKCLSDYKSPCWYNIEEYLAIFLNENNINKRNDSLNSISRINIDIIYNSIKCIIRDNVCNMLNYNSGSKKYSHLKHPKKDYNLIVLMLIYFVLLDDKYLRKNIRGKKYDFKNYFGNHDQQSLSEHIARTCQYLSIHPHLSVDGYEDQNQEDTTEYKLYFYLKSEMSDFDMAFNDYLVEQLHKDNKYYRNSYKFIFNMAEDLINRHWDNRIGGPFFSFLNFNYTNPLEKVPHMKFYFSKSQYIRRNIHGLLTDKYLNYVKYDIGKEFFSNYRILNVFHHDYKCNHTFNHTLFHLWCYKHCVNTPLIGIDGTNISTTSLKYIFTKTYGIMRRNKGYNNRGLLAPRIKYIKFFGHSLGTADYSYFESIFDKYHIANNNSIMLIFYYNCYIDSNTNKPVSDAKASLNQLHSVSNLLYTYCRYRRINANELLSSLLLDGRLIIRNINSIKEIDDE